MSNTSRRLALVGALTLSTFALAGSALAATVTYRNDNSLSVPNNTGINGVGTSINVPAGRTPVQSIEAPGIKPFWTSGGTDMSLRLVGPGNDQMFLMTIGCPSMPNTTNFTITDAASVVADDTVMFCNNQLNGGSGRPNDPDAKTMSFFSGKPASGTWTLFVRDAGVSGTGGTLNGWGLQITHAPFQLTGSANKQKLKSSLLITAQCNANCSLQTGKDAKPTSFTLTQEHSELLKVGLTKKARKRLAEKGKAKIGLTADDGYGDTTSTTVKVKLKR